MAEIPEKLAQLSDNILETEQNSPNQITQTRQMSIKSKQQVLNPAGNLQILFQDLGCSCDDDNGLEKLINKTQ